jgi:hypothetical protein
MSITLTTQFNKPCVGKEGESCRKNNRCTYPDCKKVVGTKSAHKREDIELTVNLL